MGKINGGQREYPKDPSVTTKTKHCSDPISADPICPFPRTSRSSPGARSRRSVVVVVVVVVAVAVAVAVAISRSSWFVPSWSSLSRERSYREGE